MDQHQFNAMLYERRRQDACIAAQESQGGNFSNSIEGLVMQLWRRVEALEAEVGALKRAKGVKRG